MLIALNVFYEYCFRNILYLSKYSDQVSILGICENQGDEIVINV